MSDWSVEQANAIISLDRVTKHFGSYVAVEEAHFDIIEGEFFSMLGPSGCGKTTTLRMIAGFELPTSGSIRLAGNDVSNVPPYKRDVNTVFQQYGLFPHMSILDNVAFGLRSKKVPAAVPRRCSTSSGCRSSATASHRSFPAVSNSASRSLERW